LHFSLLLDSLIFVLSEEQVSPAQAYNKSIELMLLHGFLGSWGIYFVHGMVVGALLCRSWHIWPIQLGMSPLHVRSADT
jgi:hypothetical protein